MYLTHHQWGREFSCAGYSEWAWVLLGLQFQGDYFPLVNVVITPAISLAYFHLYSFHLASPTFLEIHVAHVGKIK
jgi:hypothetical protein